MPIDYSIAAIPTVYRGRRYRSRLEARWAAFFDLLGWAHEYEPADLGLWSPDFLLRTQHVPILVEVKPLTALDEDTIHKMVAASEAADFRGALLLVGTAPFLSDNDRPVIGWLGSAEFDWFDAIPCLSQGELDLNGSATAVAEIAGRWDLDLTYLDGSTVMERWASACNEVQWTARK